MNTLSRFLFASISLTSLLTACGKSSAPDPSSTGTASAPASSNAKAGDAPGKPGVVASCMKGTTTCVEYRNVLQDYVEGMCTAGPDYVFHKGNVPCPTDKVAGTCANKLTPDETSYWYATSPEDVELAKGLCEISGQWTPTPKGGASAAGPKSPTPSAGAKKAKK